MEHIPFEKTYTDEQENLIASEFRRLEDKHYLDHVGATLYSEKQLQNVFKELSTNLFGNPHAGNVSSKTTEDTIDIIRYLILDHFNTNAGEYSIVFTRSATEALKTVAECFQFNNGCMAYLENNHTSVLGMRSYAPTCKEIKMKECFQLLSTNNKPEQNIKANSNNLFVYPAQCNFSGTKYPPQWIENVKTGALNSVVDVQTRNWYVILDCASFVSTNVLDLSKWKPDFVPISFYKIFGYPTGLGGLLVRKCSEEVLYKKYHGGGTVLMALSSQNVMVPRPVLWERFEDGTLPFLSIIAIRHGFDTIKRLKLNFETISKHTFSLAQYVYKKMLVMHHYNGKPFAEFYHDTTFENPKHQGGIVNFNLLRANGDYIGYSEVLQFANLYGIQLRTGCFCNPGACQRFLKLSTEDVKRHFNAGHVCGDQHDLVDGYPTGSVRISFGYMSTIENADGFLTMIKDCFIEKPIIYRQPKNYDILRQQYNELFSKRTSAADDVNNTQSYENVKTITCKIPLLQVDDIEVKNPGNNYGILQQIFLYPIKSCGAFSAKKWELTDTGLAYDRQWMIVNSAGTGITQKNNKLLCLITPTLDVERNVLSLHFPDADDIEISLSDNLKANLEVSPCKSKVCGDQIRGWDCGDSVAKWLSSALNTPGLRLLRQCPNTEDTQGRLPKKIINYELSLANKAQFLMLNTASVKWLKDKLPPDEFNETLDSIISRFRANFIVNFEEPFQENEFEEFSFNENLVFKSGGKCTRCQMICINQHTGETSKEPLATLSREFKGKIAFGLYLNHEGTSGEVEVGNVVRGEISKQ